MDLLIIGNGFDLSCGLPTKYIDYFNSDEKKASLSFLEKYFAEDSINYQYTGDISVSPDQFLQTTVWDWLFVCNKSKGEMSDPRWADVEKNIFDFLNPRNDLNWESIVEGYRLIEKKGFPSGNNSKEKLILLLYDLFDKISSRNASCQDQIRKWKENFDRDPYGFLLDQLKLFEKDFKGYIRKVFEQDAEYPEKAQMLLAEIVGDARTNVISFNYTVPLDVVFDPEEGENPEYTISFESSGQVVAIENVHGSIYSGDNIILGIDQELIDQEMPDRKDILYRFTKTARKINDLDEKTEYNPVLTDEIQSIKMYGHSLNQQDYSYFQSIFDHYEIYGSSIELYFYYYSYSDIIKEEYTNAVIALMRRYGESMVNIKQGRNLIHKLLIENRLKIIRIQELPWMTDAPPPEK